MSLNEDIKNCRMVIRDVESGETIADTTILTYDAGKDQIEIAASSGKLQEGSVISALIFCAAGLVESHGTVGGTQEDKILITLYEGTAKNDRHAVRYQVNIQGNVDLINRPSEGKITDAFEITVLNMSSIGLLMQAPAGKIKAEDVVRFSAITKGQRIIITAEATRVDAGENGTEKVGCSVQLVNLG